MGGVFYSSISGLLQLDPPDDPFLVATFHFYEPFAFTHQGATWVSSVPPLGTTWVNQRTGFGNGWQNWSWNTDFTMLIGSLGIEYTEGWAGIRFHTNSPIEGSDKLSFTVDGSIHLQAIVLDANGDELFRQTVQTASGVNEYEFDFDFTTPIGDVMIQNFSPNPQAPFQLSDVELSGTGVSVHLIETEEEAIANAFMQAQMWSIVNGGIPVHLGEFGAYNPADIDSRVRWTTAVRSWSEALDFPFSYWELGAGFGVYDPNGNAWRTRLIQSLIPEFQP